jgi:hypothetical protein
MPLPELLSPHRPKPQPRLLLGVPDPDRECINRLGGEISNDEEDFFFLTELLLLPLTSSFPEADD